MTRTNCGWQSETIITGILFQYLPILYWYIIGDLLYNDQILFLIKLQTEPSLISQVIPGIGKILVDGVVTPAHPTPTQITNGIRHPPPVHQPHAVRQPAPVRPSPPVTVRQPTPPARAPVPAGQNTAAKGRQLAPYAPIQPKPGNASMLNITLLVHCVLIWCFHLLFHVSIVTVQLY